MKRVPVHSKDSAASDGGPPLSFPSSFLFPSLLLSLPFSHICPIGLPLSFMTQQNELLMHWTKNRGGGGGKRSQITPKPVQVYCPIEVSPP